MLNFLKKLPIIRQIPGFSSIPSNIERGSLRFYKLSNLVLTLGMFVHASWVTAFFLLDVKILSFINIGSLAVYISGIVINRYGKHFLASVLMVSEIILHQLIAVNYLGTEPGFQYFLIVISIFPFLMPKGKWLSKSLLLTACLVTYIFIDFYYTNVNAYYTLSETSTRFFRITNLLASFVSLCISGAYFTMAMHETEEMLEQKTEELKAEKDKSHDLLLNILPEETATELLENGNSTPTLYKEVTVLFTDFKHFTSISEKLSPDELVKEIHYYYSAYDKIIQNHKVEKIKTIGDSYLCASGLPAKNAEHAMEAMACAIEIREFTENEKLRRKAENRPYFEIRIGLHSGPVVAGIVGIKKFAYDIWGDTVNVASRMEGACPDGAINLSKNTYELVKSRYNCQYRGKIAVKNKGEIDMYVI